MTKAVVPSSWRRGRLVTADQPGFVEDYPAAMERALYREAALLEADLAGLAEGDPRRPELYFLGIAGDGTQRVFSREVAAVRGYFEGLGLTAARQVSLVNNRDWIGERPMATLTSIARSLEVIGQRMNPEQDLLVVYLSSHGSAEHELSLENEAIELVDLPARTLAGMLRSSGIRYRAIIVSACYSGGFLAPLRNDSTLVMTAAAADRTSFGCSDQAELTYFGRALLDSLPRGEDARQVFEHLSREVARREAEEDLTGSQPQFFLGPDMAQKLAAFPGLFAGQADRAGAGSESH